MQPMRNKKNKLTRVLKFPDGFLWGSATSAYQVEGGITQNDWVQSKMPASGLACDHFHRFEEDFKLAKKLGQNAHRLSLEWSRIEPVSGVFDEAALDHYEHVLDFLKEKGFTTFVTLHHFTNPIWFAKEGGWVSRKSVDYFVRFTEKVVGALGELIDFWITVNEPNIYANLSYLRGIWPPFRQSSYESYQVYRHMLSAHNKAYGLIHGNYPEAQVGFAQNISFNQAFDDTNFLDKLLVRFADWTNIDYPMTRSKTDFVGLNYYSRNLRKFGSFPRHRTVRAGQLALTDKGWEIYPKGLYEVLLKLKKFSKPIYILENGIADARDRKRAKFITDHLRTVYRAIKRGADVKGYFYWSLLDNYEWPVLPAEKTGYEMKFGLLEVDFMGDLKRKIRKSARAYAKICKNNGLVI